MNTTNRELWKLSALGHTIQSSTVDIFDAKEYLKFLCLNQDPGNLRKTLTSIENFNKRLMTEMSKSRPDRSAVPKPNTTFRSVPDETIPWLQTTFNPSYWSASQKLFEALDRHLKSCKSSAHSVMLNLKGLEPPTPQDEEARFGILLPSCPEEGSWQETYCHVLYKR
jgi:hypothetical protein